MFWNKENREDTKSFISGFVCGLLLMGAVVFGVFAYTHSYLLTAMKSDGLTVKQALQLVKKADAIVRTLDSLYLGEYDTEALLDGAYEGMAEAVGDPYTRYYTQEQYEKFQVSTTGTYGGLGVTIVKNDATGRIRVVSVYEGGPSEAAGVQQGDEFMKVEGEDVTGLTTDELAAKLKGPIDTAVTITFYRPATDSEVEIEITRKKIEVPTVEHEMLEDGVGYIAISSFDEITPNQFDAALEELRGQGLRGLILDLRDNLGGRVDAVEKIADALLPEGIITYTVDKNGEKITYNSDAEHSLGLPLTVLVNENSASASEILAGAIQDHGVGTLVGTRTYGKGLVQRTVPFQDDTALKVTMAKYYTPNGNYIHGVGIEPDIVIDLPTGVSYQSLASHQEDIQFLTAYEALQTMLD
ncbi:S41 family peptidase [Bianquea renquensis]|jgi:peptidase, S41 family|uniref:S41 family peptidase n=1 Tax=Bianquea renquensis TaxID=2763661 RepID=A0A926DU33_9FIRM|nr:S41 family peptidase [Bianquea renquensis]MBC8543300.1 S41 family peptidase [Bianquea renquensis]